MRLVLRPVKQRHDREGLMLARVTPILTIVLQPILIASVLILILIVRMFQCLLPALSLFVFLRLRLLEIVQIHLLCLPLGRRRRLQSQLLRPECLYA